MLCTPWEISPICIVNSGNRGCKGNHSGHQLWIMIYPSLLHFQKWQQWWFDNDISPSPISRCSIGLTQFRLVLVNLILIIIGKDVATWSTGNEDVQDEGVPLNVVHRCVVSLLMDIHIRNAYTHPCLRKNPHLWILIITLVLVLTG